MDFPRLIVVLSAFALTNILSSSGLEASVTERKLFILRLRMLGESALPPNM